MKNIHLFLAFTISFLSISCNAKKQTTTNSTDKIFADFENSFLDAYWKHYPTASIMNGYGKYYDLLVIPDSAAFASNIAFSKSWLETLNTTGFDKLNDNNKISFNIIKNQLESDIWYTSVFKQQEWDASIYNISAPCDYIINQQYAPLDQRLKILSKYLQHTDEYFKAALKTLKQPMKGQVELSIVQNLGGLDVFGKTLADSIKISHLSNSAKDSLQQNIAIAVKAINNFVSSLKAIVADKNYVFRDFRIGKKLFDEKFKYDLATDLSIEQVYKKATADKKLYHHKMFVLADSIWSKYYNKQAKPKDSLQLIQMVLNKIQLNHVKPAEFYSAITKQVHQLKKFIIEKNLFDFDTTTPPIIVRYMPAYARGFTSASADFSPPYQKQGATYYNIDDLTLYQPDKAESALREDNIYASQILSIHEAVPGHCVQSIYNNKKSPDVLRSVFQNGAMIEGWAVYTEGMMIENGWGNHEAEIELALYTWKLRELANVIIDYDIQCQNKSKEDIVHFLTKECFQTDAQVQEKYHRATLSQVQLCSYYTGSTAILSLREEYKKKMGDKYSLKDFHEKFLSFGSSPVKYIRERMLQ